MMMMMDTHKKAANNQQHERDRTKGFEERRRRRKHTKKQSIEICYRHTHTEMSVCVCVCVLNRRTNQQKFHSKSKCYAQYVLYAVSERTRSLNHSFVFSSSTHTLSLDCFFHLTRINRTTECLHLCVVAAVECLCAAILLCTPLQTRTHTHIHSNSQHTFLCWNIPIWCSATENTNSVSKCTHIIGLGDGKCLKNIYFHSSAFSWIISPTNLFEESYVWGKKQPIPCCWCRVYEPICFVCCVCIGIGLYDW